MIWKWLSYEFGWYLSFALYILFYIFHIYCSRINGYMCSMGLVLFLVFCCYHYLFPLRKTDCVQGFGSLIENESTRKKRNKIFKEKKGVEIFCSSSLVFSSAPWAYVLAKTSIAESETIFCNFKATRVSLSSPSKEGYHYKILMERFLGNKTPTGFNGRRCADCGTMEFILKSGFPSYAAYSS